MKHIQYSTYPLNHAITMKMQYALDRRMKNDTQDIGREKKETSFVVVERLPSYHHQKLQCWKTLLLETS